MLEGGECPTLPPLPGHLCVMHMVEPWNATTLLTIAAAPLVFTSSHSHARLTRPQGLDSGWRLHVALQKAVAATVSGGNTISVSWDHLETLHAAGIVTSPNYPDRYPNNLDRTDTIQVLQGLILKFQFTAFDIYDCPQACLCDHLTIMDGDGTTLIEKSCGSTADGSIVIGGQSLGFSLLSIPITSRSNVVNLMFSSDGSLTWPGWSLSWSAVTPGESHSLSFWKFLHKFLSPLFFSFLLR